MNIKEIKELKFYSQDLNKELTVREYLVKLLKTLWIEEKGFSGKRPFGNSGWQFDLHKLFVKKGLVKGKIDEDDYVSESDTSEVNRIICEVILSLK